MPISHASSVQDRVDALDWNAAREQFDGRGFAITERLLDGSECADLSELFDGGRFRSTIDMARHRFGDGRYRSTGRTPASCHGFSATSLQRWRVHPSAQVPYARSR